MNTLERIDNERWLLNNGLISDSAKNNIYMYAYLVHKDVAAAEVGIDIDSKTINYTLYLKKNTFEAFEYYQTRSNSWFSLLKSAYLVKKHGNLNFSPILSTFVKGYAGPGWQAVLVVKSEKDYT